MKKQKVTFTIWDGGGSFTIDFTKPYYKYIQLFSVSSFKELTDDQAVDLLKTIIKDFREGKLNSDVLCGLCYEMFFACDIFHKDEKLNDLMLSLTELSFDLRNSPVCAAESLDNAFNFLSLPEVKRLSSSDKSSGISKKDKIIKQIIPSEVAKDIKKLFEQSPTHDRFACDIVSFLGAEGEIFSKYIENIEERESDLAKLLGTCLDYLNEALDHKRKQNWEKIKKLVLKIGKRPVTVNDLG